MRRLALIGLIGVMGASAAETNITITFTNLKTHAAVYEAKVERVMPTKIMYRMTNGIGAIAEFKELPEDLRSLLGYDPEKAAESVRRDQMRAAAEQAQLAEGAAMRQRMAEIGAHETILWATVIQRLGTNLLVDADARGDFPHDQHHKLIVENWNGHRLTNLASGTVLLSDFPKASGKVDGDKFAIMVYPAGDYEYVAVSGGKKTVRRYTVNPMKALLP